jgi:hypothetical protein
MFSCLWLNCLICMFRVWFIQNRLLLKFVSNGKKLTSLNKLVPTNEDLWEQAIRATGLWGLANTGFSHLDRSLLCGFVERWHKKTNSFHIPSREMTVTLDDVYCLLHLPIEGILLDHHGIIGMAEHIELMVTYLGSSPGQADHQFTMTRGAHAWFTNLRILLLSHLQRIFRC